MAESTPPPEPRPLAALAADLRDQRRAALHAIHVLEYALTAPAPRRHRTWLHRVAVAVDALYTALRVHADSNDTSLTLLDEIALSDPGQLDRDRPGGRPRAPRRADAAIPSAPGAGGRPHGQVGGMTRTGCVDR